MPDRPTVSTRQPKNKSQFGRLQGKSFKNSNKLKSTLMRRSKTFCRHHLRGEDEDSEEFELRIAKRVEEKSDIMKMKAKMKREAQEENNNLKRTKGGKKIKRKESVVNEII